MAIADLAAYKLALKTHRNFPSYATTGSQVHLGRTGDSFRNALPTPTAPTTSVVPTNATTGAVPFSNSTSGTLTCVGAQLGGNQHGVFYMYDRLVHSGGLSGTVTTAQTTNLPTAALTRYTSGEGCQIALICHAAVGATATTVTASYTNQAGTAGRTTVAYPIGGTGFNAVDRMLFLPLQVGDTGVRSVESVTIAATTGTAGNILVAIVKPLCAFVLDDFTTQINCNLFNSKFFGGLPEIIDDASLFFLYVGTGYVSTFPLSVQLYFAEH